MTRVLQPELLDELPSTDPRAVHSRRDLRRINKVMGNGRLIADFVSRNVRTDHPLRLAEIGAGDGNVGSQVARRFSSGELTLIDRTPLARLEIPGWSIHLEEADVFEWFELAPQLGVIVANLFLHHFETGALRDLLKQCAAHCDLFVAAEPRRTPLAAWFARRVRLIGCNDVTRHDAEISVHAGFRDNELSALWPRIDGWTVIEKKAGLFTHFFAAIRKP